MFIFTEIFVDEKTISRIKKQILSLSNSVVYLPNTLLVCILISLFILIMQDIKIHS